MEYRVVVSKYTKSSSVVADFENEIDILLEDGWELQGGVSFVVDEGINLAQALIRKDHSWQDAV